MAEVRPFRGVHYNKALLNDWPSIVCPVYDIISPQQQQDLYLRSECNFVRLEFARELPQDSAMDNRYSRARDTLEQWLKQGVLVVDEKPAMYLYDQHFTHQGRKYRRRGLIACVRLEEWDKMVVRPHEGTMAEPKTDRLNLLWALQANTSPVLALYEDRDKNLSSLFAVEERTRPLLDLRKADGESHRLWGITDFLTVDRIQRHLAEQPLYVADGHHRYESALAYQRQKLASLSSPAGEEGFNFVMMTLVDFGDPGLLVLPPHRLVRGIGRATLDGLMPKLRFFFDIEELRVDAPDIWQDVDRRLDQSRNVSLALYGLGRGELLILSLRDPGAVNSMMPYFHSDLYKRLDVSVLDHVILEEFLGLGSENRSQLLGYTYEKADAVKRVLAQEYQLAFLIRPPKAETIKAIADVRDRMPKKSTYFYPKTPAGLIVHRLT